MLSDVIPYKPSQFSREDYRILASRSSSYLQGLIKGAQTRDKRIRRKLDFKESEVFHCPLEDVPLYLNDDRNPYVLEIAKWRLHINK